MTVDDLINALNSRVDDELHGDDAVYEWFNSGLNQLGVAVQAVFPQLSQTTDTPVIPSKYHEALVIFAAAKYKERDSSLSESGNFMQQFAEIKKEFNKFYDPPLQYRDDNFSQLFTATAGQLAYVITNSTYDPKYGDLKIFYNGRLLAGGVDYQIVQAPAGSYSQIQTTNTTTNDPNGFMLDASMTINAGDLISAVWEEHADLADPPYDFWRW